MTMIEHPSCESDANRLSAEFLHALRTPLNHIMGYSEILTEQALEEGQAGFVPDLKNIQIAARQLLDLLNARTPLLNAPGEEGIPPQAAPISEKRMGILPDGARNERPAAEATGELILVVDDNSVNRDVLSRRLERQGYEVAIAVDGHEALDSVRGRAFDLVLLDIMMPIMDGFEVLRQLKEDAALCHIPVIMVSALDETDGVVRCIEMGAEDYLPKPFDPILLKARIRASLGKKHARDRETLLFEELRQNYVRLQELEKVRDDLTNMIVHDLRTPLTSVIAGMQTLEMIGGLDALQKELADNAISGGETLLGMINDLLDIEKMEAGAMQLDYDMLSATALIAAAASQTGSLSVSKNMTTDIEIAPGLPSFRGDEEKLRRVLVNLLGNAIKFTPEGGRLTIGAALAEDAGSLRFFVSDTGEGINADAFESIFEKFGQVAERKGGRTMSTGLGLTFCKLAVEAHGGQIGVSSVPHEGSTFSFTIPLNAG